MKLLLPSLIGALLAIPLFAIYLLVYDRQSQSETAQASIAQGSGGPQVIAGPVLVIPWSKQVSETVTGEDGKRTTKVSTEWHDMMLSPDMADLKTDLTPSVRHRSIYDVVVYEAHNRGSVRFVLPPDLDHSGITPDTLAFDRAQLRFGISDAHGLFGPPPAVIADGKRLTLQPGNGVRETGGSGFSAFVDASQLKARSIAVTFEYGVRGTGSLSFVPNAGDTSWKMASSWTSPSFQGSFLPSSPPKIGDTGFNAVWRGGNLALGKALVAVDVPQTDPAAAPAESVDISSRSEAIVSHNGALVARVDLVTPVDIYSQVNRSVKYGFLFIGFTFLAFLMFDVIGGVRVSAIEYALVGSGLVLFFVMLLAFAEVVGFTPAYLIAGGAIISLLTFYSAAVLASRTRGMFIAFLLSGLYGILYLLLSLEDLSLLAGSVLLFLALAAVMYLTRGIDWGGAASDGEVVMAE
ncbi:MAG: cell envelope integrity protein CreD [Sphingomonas sp.]